MEDAFTLIYIAASIFFISHLLIRSKRYFVRKSVSGEVLLKIRPSGLRFLEPALYLLLLIVPAVWVFSRFEPETMLYIWIKMWLLLNSHILITIVFVLFPTKVCENGIIDSYNYVSWNSAISYSRKSDTYVVLELDKLHKLCLKLKLRHPVEYRDKVDAILSERVRVEQA
jgi:hypothetical protein